MQHPEYYYYAALVLIALPCVPFNRVAAVVVLVWVFGQFTSLAGLEIAYGDIIADTVGLVFALAYSFAHFRPSNRFAAIMFVPMIAIDIMDLRNALSPTYCYWASFSVAMVQILALPGGNDWQRAKRTWDCYRRSGTVDWFFRTLARRHAL